jgi:hypothetical protein
MAKPLFLIGFPINSDNESVYHVQSDLSNKLDGEYHVIAYKAPEIDSIKFEVLNAVDATDIEISELILKTNSYIEEVLKETDEFLQAFNENNFNENESND